MNLDKPALLSYIFLSTAVLSAGDYAWQKFSPKTGQGVWTSVCVNPDGGVMAAAAWNDYPYLSKDGGTSWAKKSPAGSGVVKGWNSVSMSDDGTKIALSAWNDHVYYSADGGATWAKKSPAGTGVVKGWNSLSLSGDGTVVAACAWNDHVYYSADSGATWAKKSPAGADVAKGWNSISMNGDGKKIVVSAWNDYVYYSADGGATWAKKSPAGAAKGWSSVCINDAGTVIIAVAYNDYLYLSADGGATWAKKAPAGSGITRGWTSLDCNSDGMVIAASAVNSYVYTSKDGGGNWEKNSPSGGSSGLNWQAVSLSATGTKLLAGTQGAYVYAGISATLGWTVVFEAGTGGTIAGEATQTVLNGADCLPVTAVPDDGYSFVDWTGGVSSTDNPLTVTKVAENMKITANFQPVAQDPGDSAEVLKFSYRARHSEKFLPQECDGECPIACKDTFSIRAKLKLGANFDTASMDAGTSFNVKLGAWDSGVLRLKDAYEFQSGPEGGSALFRFFRAAGDGSDALLETIALKWNKKGILNISVEHGSSGGGSSNLVDLGMAPDSKVSGSVSAPRISFGKFSTKYDPSAQQTYSGRKSSRTSAKGTLVSWSVKGN